MAHRPATGKVTHKGMGNGAPRHPAPQPTKRASFGKMAVKTKP